MSNAQAVPATVERVSATDIDGPAYIEAKAVRKVFTSRDKTPVVALDGADLNIGVGEFVSLLGPSGCGKSTLLSMIAGLVPASEGSIRIEGTEVREPYTNIGIVFQNDLLLDWHTVLGNVLVQYVMRGQDPKPHVERARALIASVGLKDFEQKYPWELSGGMRQRVAICRALIHEPPLLLMDEPFGALDALTREQLQVDLQRIWQGTKKTVVFVTHSIDEAIFLSDRVVVMTPRPGRIHDVLRINLQRPRSLAVRDSDVFADNVRHVNHLFQTMGVIHE